MESLIQEEKDFYCSLASALTNLKPGAVWNISGEDYDTLDWHADNTITKPTKAQVDAEILRLTNDWKPKQLNLG